MTTGCDLLREFWRAGVRVEVSGDRFRLTPPGVAPEAMRDTLREFRPDVVEVLADLPAAGRCPICGASNGWSEIDGTTTAHCVNCALIAIDRILEQRRDISNSARSGDMTLDDNHERTA